MSNFKSTDTPQQSKSRDNLHQSVTLRAIRFDSPSTGNSEGLCSRSSFFLQSELLNKNVLSYCFSEIFFEYSNLRRYENSLEAYRQYAFFRIPAPELQAAVAGLTTDRLVATASTPETYCLRRVA